MFCVGDMWSNIVCVASTCSQCLVAVVILPDLIIGSGLCSEGKVMVALWSVWEHVFFTLCICVTCSQCLVTFPLLPYVLVSYVINYVHLFPIDVVSL